MATIGIMDSGKGGLSVLREIVKALPGEHYIYFADTANCPYGPRSREWIEARVREIVTDLIGRGAQAIVIACNTATAAAIKSLRAEFPDIPFVGMEPAVKPAALASQTGVIGVLATKSTLSASKYLDTRDRFADDVKVVEHVGEGFVELVEKGETQGPHAEEVVRASLMPLLNAGADKIVLGCTHYPFLLPALEKVAAELSDRDIEFIDPAPAVARQLVRMLESHGIPTSPGAKKEQPDVELLSSE